MPPNCPMRRGDDHGSWVMWVMGQLYDVSHGSWGHERSPISISDMYMHSRQLIRCCVSEKTDDLTLAAAFGDEVDGGFDKS